MGITEIKNKAVEAMSIRVLIYLLVGSGGGGVAFAWGSDIWGSVARSKENAAQIQTMTTAMTAHNISEEQAMQKIQQDLTYLKMLWGDVQIQTTGDELTAAVNSRSPAGRFQPGTEVWVTNNTDPGEVRIKIEIEERRFRDNPEILMRMSRKAGEDLEASEGLIYVSLEPVPPETKEDDD